MKLLTLLLLLALLPLQNLQALYCGNPDEPELIDSGLFSCRDDRFSVKAGYEGDFVANRRLHAKGDVGGSIDRFTAQRNQGVLTFNLFNRLELYGSAGAMRAHFTQDDDSNNQQREFQMTERFTWGVGGRMLLFTWKNLHLGASGAYQYAHLPLKSNTLDGAGVATEGAKMNYWEWQLSPLLSYRVEMFDPYIGFVYSCAEAELRKLNPALGLGHSNMTLKSRNRAGMVLGCSLTPSRIVDVNIEIRLFDEEAITFAGNIKF